MAARDLSRQGAWTDAQAAAQKLSKQPGITIDRPSESQWEYACGASKQGDANSDFRWAPPCTSYRFFSKAA
jgi:formylglycine-generating enzyme required for sulfatase activity